MTEVTKGFDLGVSSDDLLGGSMRTATVPAPSRTANRKRSRAVLDEALRLTERMEEMQGLSEEDKAAVRQRILSADLEGLRNALPDDQKSLAAIVEALDAEFEQIGDEFAKVQDYAPNEQAIIDRAHQRKAEATSALETARAHRVAVESKISLWPGRRAKKIVEADDAIRAAQAHLEEVGSDAAMAEAEKKARHMRSTRLQGADFSASYDVIMRRLKLTVDALQSRVTMLEGQYNSNTGVKTKAFQQKAHAAKVIEDTKAELATLQAEYSLALQECSALPAGSVERVKKEEEASDLKKRFDEVRTRHDSALVTFQAKEEATKKLGMDEVALRAGIHAHRVLLQKLVADAESWVVEFESKLAQVRAMADQEAADKLVQVGAKVRIRHAEQSAQFAIAALGTITTMAEQFPENMSQLSNIQKAMVEGLNDVAKRWEAIGKSTRDAIAPSNDQTEGGAS